MAKTKIQAPPGKQEIIITRTYDAPRDLVYRMVTDPKLINEWWGPRNLTTTVERMEVKPGGAWRFVQRDAEGNIYAFHGVYHEAKAPELLVYTMEWEGMPGHVLLDIERFEEHDGITTCISKSVFDTVEDRDGMLQTGAESGTDEVTDRLNELLAKLKQGTLQASMPARHVDGGSLKITRLFNASRQKVWQQWADPNAYLCWWGPKDYSGCEAHIDMHVGGKYISCIEGPDGKKYWNTGIYKEIVEPNHFVVTDSWADEHGNIVPASYYGMGSDIPLEMEVEVTLEDLDGKTRMIVEESGFSDGNTLEQYKLGWNESFDKLEHCLQ